MPVESWMKTIAVWLTIALIPAYPASLRAQIVTCPPGTYLSIDQLGKPNCLRVDDHTLAIIQASPTVICPSGTYRTVDAYGTRVCKSVDPRGPTYYGYPTNTNTLNSISPDNSTPKSSTPMPCPAGSFPAGVGIFGNQICRQM